LDDFFVNVTNNTKIKILDYIYWQYKNKNNPIKVNMGELKKFLEYKTGLESYIRPIEFAVKCNVCNGKVLSTYIVTLIRKILNLNVNNVTILLLKTNKILYSQVYANVMDIKSMA